MTQANRTWVEVDLEAVRANARTVQQRAGTRLLPMVKADGYGLGAVALTRALEPLDPWGFGVATPEEGAALRAAGVRRPIIVFSPLTGALAIAAAQDLVPALGSVEQVRAWRALAGDRAFHFQVDTGMGRGGVHYSAFGAAAADLDAAAGFAGVFTHFHSAATDAGSVREQWERFAAALAQLRRRPPLVHAANSAAALGHPETVGDMVRPGIFLYGGRTGPHVPRPVVTWHARVVESQLLPAGSTVSYDATFRLESPACITTLSVGYADGVRRDLSNSGEVLIAGRRHGVAGRVTMDLTTVWTRGPAPEAGNVATLIGRDGDDAIALDDHAAWAGTISYDILTGLGSRVQRVYV